MVNSTWEKLPTPLEKFTPEKFWITDSNTDRELSKPMPTEPLSSKVNSDSMNPLKENSSKENTSYLKENSTYMLPPTELTTTKVDLTLETWIWLPTSELKKEPWNGSKFKKLKELGSEINLLLLPTSSTLTTKKPDMKDNGPTSTETEKEPSFTLAEPNMKVTSAIT